VAVHHRGGHTTYYNSKALEMAGITKSTPSMAKRYLRPRLERRTQRPGDRPCARRVRQGRQEAQLFRRRGDATRTRRGWRTISKQFVRSGLTGVCHQGRNLRALQQVRANGDLLHRVSYEAHGAELEAMITGGMATGLGRRVDQVGEPPLNTPPTGRSPNARWRSASHIPAFPRLIRAM